MYHSKHESKPGNPILKEPQTTLPLPPILLHLRIQILRGFQLGSLYLLVLLRSWGGLCSRLLNLCTPWALPHPPFRSNWSAESGWWLDSRRKRHGRSVRNQIRGQVSAADRHLRRSENWCLGVCYERDTYSAAEPFAKSPRRSIKLFCFGGAVVAGRGSVMSCTLILLSAREDEESVSRRNSLMWYNIYWPFCATLQRDKMNE